MVFPLNVPFVMFKSVSGSVINHMISKIRQTDPVDLATFFIRNGVTFFRNRNKPHPHSEHSYKTVGGVG